MRVLSVQVEIRIKDEINYFLYNEIEFIPKL